MLNVAYTKLLFAYKRINTSNARFGFVAVPMPYNVPTPYKIGEAGHLFDGRASKLFRSCTAVNAGRTSQQSPPGIIVPATRLRPTFAIAIAGLRPGNRIGFEL